MPVNHRPVCTHRQVAWPRPCIGSSLVVLLVLWGQIAACGRPVPIMTDTLTPATMVTATGAGPEASPVVALVGQIGGVPGALRHPTGLAIDRQGTLYVVESSHDQVRPITSDGQQLAPWGGTGSRPGQFRFGRPFIGPLGDGSSEGGLLMGLTGGNVAVDTAGNVFVADILNTRIQSFDRQGRFKASLGHYNPFPSAGLEAVHYQAILPYGLAVDQHGNVYIADSSHSIQKYDRDGTFLLAWGGRGREEGRFISPMAVAADHHGDIFVADRGNHRIQKFDAYGRFLTAWGVPGSGAGEFAGPIFLAVDGHGRVYVADSGNHRVQVFDGDGAFLAQWGRLGRDEGQFLAPSGIAVDEQGDIYVADLITGRIQKFRPRGPWPAGIRPTPVPRPATPTPLVPTPGAFTPTDR